MKAPVHNLTKAQLVWLGSHRCHCKSPHTYLEHYTCFLNENPNMEEKIGFLDIETSMSFDANFSIILTWTIKPLKQKVVFDSLTEKDFTEHRKSHTLFYVDTRLVQNLVDEVSKYDRIITHYGRKFDIPFIRTRALIDKIKFPYFGVLVNDDVYYWARYKLRLNSNRLETVVNTLIGHSNKTHLDGKIWVPASMGDIKCIARVLEHNKIDVVEGEKEYLILKDFVGKRNTSI